MPITFVPWVTSNDRMTERVAGRVSVIVPCFNGVRHLREALESALAQTHRDVEIVVVDDGSTDDSATIAEGYAPRVCCIRQDNAGPSAARNRALAVATGEFVALLDADDRYGPTKLARQVALLRAREDVGAVYCGWRLVDAAGSKLPEHGWPHDEGDLTERLLMGNLFHPVSVVLRADAVARVGGFDIRCPVNEDWDLFLRLSRTGTQWACVDEALCDYRIHAGQSHQRLALVHGVAAEIIDRFFADPGLPRALQRFEPRAREGVDLRAAAEFFSAGSDSEGRAALRRALERRPAILGESKTAMRLLRLMLPDGYRSRLELVRRRRMLRALLRGAFQEAGRTPGEQGRAWRTRAIVALRLEWRAALGRCRGSKG